jgi:Holliday junction resolvase
MASNRAKGNYYEKKSKDFLESKGYQVERALAKIFWLHGRPISQHHDFFGLFDLIAVKEEEVLFVQVKFEGETHEGSSLYGEKMAKMKAFSAPLGSKILHTWKLKGRKAVLEVEEVGV